MLALARHTHGRTAWRSLASQLPANMQHTEVWCLFMPPCHDPNDVSMMAVEAVATTVLPLSFTHDDFPMQCRSMTIAGVAFLIGCVWQVAAKRYVALLLVGRIFWGVGVGFADQSVTIYNAEMAPPQWRGLLHILFQLATVTGNDGYRTSFSAVTIFNAFWLIMSTRLP